MTVRILQVDAFTDRPFAGNPAAVCLLKEERDAGWMQAVAAEMNLSETAFVRALDDSFELRWFTLAIEVELCGHATLAAAHALWTECLVKAGHSIRFHTKSGVLTCTQAGDLIELDFPATPAREADPPAGLLDAFGVQMRSDDLHAFGNGRSQANRHTRHRQPERPNDRHQSR